MDLARYFARAPFVLGNGIPVPGWTVCDHKAGRGSGKPIHEGTMDKDTARTIAKALNDGTVTPEEVAQA